MTTEVARKLPLAPSWFGRLKREQNTCSHSIANDFRWLSEPSAALVVLNSCCYLGRKFYFGLGFHRRTCVGGSGVVSGAGGVDAFHQKGGAKRITAL